MADNRYPNPEQDAIDALRALSEHVPPAKCPICNTMNWTVESEPGGLLSSWRPMPGLLGFKSATLPTSPIVPTLVLSCENCGFIRQHNIPTLAKKGRGG